MADLRITGTAVLRARSAATGSCSSGTTARGYWTTPDLGDTAVAPDSRDDLNPVAEHADDLIHVVDGIGSEALPALSARQV
jgi:hypothetical protein